MEGWRTRSGYLVCGGDPELTNPKDLVVLVADKNAHFALRGALNRPKALGIRTIEFEFQVHPQRDGGVRKNGPELLRAERKSFSHAVLMLDFEGSGSSCRTAKELEAEMQERIEQTWHTHGIAVVADPEVDGWLWGSDNTLAQILGWSREQSVRAWLKDRDFAFNGNHKPERPKEAIEAVLREQRIPRSSSLYESITSRLSVNTCVDPAAVRLRHWLREKFGNSGTDVNDMSEL